MFIEDSSDLFILARVTTPISGAGKATKQLDDEGQTKHNPVIRDKSKTIYTGDIMIPSARPTVQ